MSDPRGGKKTWLVQKKTGKAPAASMTAAPIPMNTPSMRSLDKDEGASILRSNGQVASGPVWGANKKLSKQEGGQLNKQSFPDLGQQGPGGVQSLRPGGSAGSRRVPPPAAAAAEPPRLAPRSGFQDRRSQEGREGSPGAAAMAATTAPPPLNSRPAPYGAQYGRPAVDGGWSGPPPPPPPGPPPPPPHGARAEDDLERPVFYTSRPGPAAGAAVAAARPGGEGYSDSSRGEALGSSSSPSYSQSSWRGASRAAGAAAPADRARPDGPESPPRMPAFSVPKQPAAGPGAGAGAGRPLEYGLAYSPAATPGPSAPVSRRESVDYVAGGGGGGGGPLGAGPLPPRQGTPQAYGGGSTSPSVVYYQQPRQYEPKSPARGGRGGGYGGGRDDGRGRQSHHPSRAPGRGRGGEQQHSSPHYSQGGERGRGYQGGVSGRAAGRGRGRGGYNNKGWGQGEDADHDDGQWRRPQQSSRWKEDGEQEYRGERPPAIARGYGRGGQHGRRDGGRYSTTRDFSAEHQPLGHGSSRSWREHNDSGLETAMKDGLNLAEEENHHQQEA